MMLLSKVINFISNNDGNITIFSPYVSLTAAKAVESSVKTAEINLFTRFYPMLFIDGSSDLEALDFLNSRGRVNIYMAPELHAKVYINNDKALVGSANLTNKGLGLHSKPNLEFLLEVNLSSLERETSFSKILAFKTNENRIDASKISLMREMIEGLKVDFAGNVSGNPIHWIPDHEYLEDHERYLIRPLGVRVDKQEVVSNDLKRLCSLTGIINYKELKHRNLKIEILKLLPYRFLLEGSDGMQKLLGYVNRDEFDKPSEDRVIKIAEALAQWLSKES